VAVVGSATQREVVHAIEESLVNDLGGRGVQAQLVEESSGTADLHVTVERVDPGSRAARYMIGYGAGEGDLIVSVTSLGVDGMARGWVIGGFMGGDSTNAASAIGHLIGRAIVTGETPGAEPQSQAAR